jgi:hypothetical protein
MKGKKAARLAAAAMCAVMMLPQCAFAQVTSAKTPARTGGSHTVWQRQFGSSGSMENSPTPPAVHGKYVYIGSGSRIIKMSAVSGSVVDKSSSLGGTMGYSTNAPVYDDGKIYAAVDVDDDDESTKIVCLDADTLDTIWQSDPVEGQNTSPVTVIGDRAYTGTWWTESVREDGGRKTVSRGYYFCVDTDSSGSGVDPVWTTDEDSSEGFYWAGAAEVNGRVVFAGDRGTVYSVDEDATSFDAEKCTDLADGSGSDVIRQTPEAYGSSVYVATKSSAKLAKIDVAGDGSLTLSGTADLDAGSTSSPVAEEGSGRLFLGTEKGTICSVDLSAETLSDSALVSSADAGYRAPGAVKGEVLVSTGYDGKILVYSTYNKKPGGICCFELDSTGTTFKGKSTLYTPDHSQYCVSPIAVSDGGKLYYKNDSNYIMAVKSGKPAQLKAASKLRAKAGRRTVKLSWSRVSGAKGYRVYRATSRHGTYRLVRKTTSRSWTNRGLKRRKRYYYRVRAYQTWNGKTLIGKWSSVRSVRTK